MLDSLVASYVFNCSDKNIVSQELFLTFYVFVTTIQIMKKKTGAPKKPANKAKGELVQIRLNSAEKQAFQDAADLDGKKLSEWIRDRLRRLSREELEKEGRAVPFLTGNSG